MPPQLNALSSKRIYSHRADYANQQGIPEKVLIAAGYISVQHKNRPALQYPTDTGSRWRYMDGLEPRHDSPFKYQPSWYGLKQALELSGRHQPLILVNGAAGVLAAQYRGIPAFAVSDGEARRIPASLLDILKLGWSGEIVIALDCDSTGRENAAKRARQLLDIGFIVRAVDLQLHEGGDIADFCKIHGDQAYDALLILPEIAPETPKMPSKRYTGGSALISSDEGARRLAANWVDQDLATLAATKSGRRDLLLTTAMKISSLVKGGYVTQSEAERGLINAAEACGLITKYGDREIQRTMADGYEYASPRVITSSPQNKPNHATQKQPQQLIATDTSELRQAQAPIGHDPLAARWGIGLWGQGVPNTVRSALLNYMPKGTALIVEILNAVIVNQLLNPQSFTRPELLEAAHMLGYTLSERTLFRYMQALEHDEMTYQVQIFFSAMGIASLAKEGVVPILTDLGVKTIDTTPKSDKNGNLRPREALVYHLHAQDIQLAAVQKYAYTRMLEDYHPIAGADPIIALLHDSMIDGMDKDQVAIWDSGVIEAVTKQNQHQQEAQKRFHRAFKGWQKELTESESFLLPSGWPLRNHGDYVRAFAHELGVATEGDHISQTKWTKWLGISTNAVRDTLHRAGLMEINPRDSVYAVINIHAPNVTDQISAACRTKKGFPCFWEAYAPDGSLIEAIPYNLNSEAIEAVIHHFRETKASMVKLKITMAYVYRVVSHLPVKVEKKTSHKRTQHQTKTPYKSASKRAKVFRAPAHNPQWLAGQSRMVMDKAGLWTEAWNFINGDGEIIEAKDNLAIIDIYASHTSNDQTPIEPVQSEEVDVELRPSRQEIADQMAAMGWRKIKIK